MDARKASEMQGDSIHENTVCEKVKIIFAGLVKKTLGQGSATCGSFEMRLRDHVYLSANCIPFPSQPNSHRLESRRVVSQSSSDSAVDVTLHVC
ncbi:hypothetical protein AVEN_36892-1 [Araneus ventricosus]|uniref:Uncharacterized protein n=1 Tax=Araneus ventricosus TaxID=182803 RepID=A0A4Y2MX96_ARAVE|nr:hypothetical protein AVEN_36892-1 [Araneus ventricosus]